MREDVALRLLEVNHTFYRAFAAPFAATRRRVQPGVRQAVADLPIQASVLDLGCGSGALARHLARRGHRGPYTGIDSSSELLAEARLPPGGPPAVFLQADLAEQGWANELHGPFDRVAAFAVLHHIPGQTRRERLLRQVRSLLAADGRLLLSVWNFLASPRLQARQIPWERVGLRAEEVDPGDALLDWREGGDGLRYLHAFGDGELAGLAARTGFRVEAVYESDGQGGRLGHYEVWSPARVVKHSTSTEEG